MIDLGKIQAQFKEWFDKNLSRGVQEDRFCNAMGIGEEAGEILHMVRVDFQGIREGLDKEKVRDEIMDGVGDVIIYAMNLCSLYGINIEDAIAKTASKVLKRDWVNNPGSAHLEGDDNG